MEFSMSDTTSPTGYFYLVNRNGVRTLVTLKQATRHPFYTGGRDVPTVHNVYGLAGGDTGRTLKEMTARGLTVELLPDGFMPDLRGVES
jgi:hypothetical protein